MIIAATAIVSLALVSSMLSAWSTIPTSRSFIQVGLFVIYVLLWVTGSFIIVDQLHLSGILMFPVVVAVAIVFGSVFFPLLHRVSSIKRE